MLDIKLFADYESNHIIMTYPSMHTNLKYYNDIKNVYINLSNILSENNILQSLLSQKTLKNQHHFLMN